jgi:glutathione peroxidase
MNKLLILSAMLLQTSIYSIHFNTSTGSDTTLANKSGKRILLVNIASNSPKVGQLAGLQQLYAQYHDSLAIVVFPSNSFGHEPLDDAGIRALCQNTYNTTFDIAAKGTVAGSSPQAIYQWLASSTENGLTSAVPAGDFHKFLLDKDGSFMGSFSPSMQPTDSTIIAAITGN